ncbi:class I SAM-dependent methyltransferase [Methanosarcina sp. T3]|uniref:class I SAM-dependent methyltransferase n=1 Tax=Methanosarcina sp. T3 TaxID=3439062 RepID=UPI003F829F7D
MVESSMMDSSLISGIDWVRFWEDSYDTRSRIMRRDYEIDDWSERAEDYSESRRTNQYEFGESVYATLDHYGVIPPNSQVLEIGSGPGTFVIPFARRVGHMTAVEPSEGMIRMIHRNAAEAGVKNYSILPKLWQDVNSTDLRGKYDLTITSTVIWMFRDIMDQIRRMEEVTQGYCCVVGGIGTGQTFEAELWKKIMGDTPHPQYPEYPLIYNLLYMHGRIPQVRIIDYTSMRTPENMFRMYRVFYSIYTEITPEVEKTIREALYRDSGEGPCVRKYRSAIVWWDPAVRRKELRGIA